jgi:hypothetical protein
MARRWMNLQFVECKTWGHAWDEYNAADNPPRGSFRWRMTLRCTRCYTTRHDYLDATGHVVSRKYGYADGYRDARGAEKPTRDEMRIVIIRKKR